MNDLAYRKHISAQLDLPFTDVGKEVVSQHGGGSSFEGQSKDGRASEMKTTERWKHFLDHKAYWAFLNQPEMLALAHQLWPEHPIWPVVKDKLGWQGY